MRRWMRRRARRQDRQDTLLQPSWRKCIARPAVWRFSFGTCTSTRSFHVQPRGHKALLQVPVLFGRPKPKPKVWHIFHIFRSRFWRQSRGAGLSSSLMISIWWRSYWVVDLRDLDSGPLESLGSELVISARKCCPSYPVSNLWTNTRCHVLQCRMACGGPPLFENFRRNIPMRLFAVGT